MVTPILPSSQAQTSLQHSGHIVLVSHCLLNQRTRAGGSFTPGVTGALLGVLSRYNVQVYQLPCPEYLFLGIREKRSQDVWTQIPGFVQFVRELADSFVKTIKPLIEERPLPLIGIARSPCCSFSKVYHGNSLVSGRGLWVKELARRLPVDAVEFDYKLVEQSLSGIEQILSQRADPT